VTTSKAEIARIIGVSRPTVYKYAKIPIRAVGGFYTSVEGFASGDQLT